MELRLPQSGDSITVIAKLAGETCNINCYYCYEKRKPYPDALVITPELLRRFLDKCEGRPLSVVLHGGEPMVIGRRRMRPLLEVLRAYEGPVAVSMQTNGTLIDHAWMDLFDEYFPKLEIGVSLDGDREGNWHRVDYANRSTYDKVVRGLDVLTARGRSIGMILVVTAQSLGLAHELIAHAMQFPCVRILKLTPCLDFNVSSKTFRGPTGKVIAVLNSGAELPQWATTPDQYTDFVLQAFDAWRDTGAYKQFLIEPLLSLIRSDAGHVPDFTQYSPMKDPYLVTLYPDGTLGSSDELRMPDSRIGHVDDPGSIQDLFAYESNRRLWSSLRDLLHECSGCTHEDTCNGGGLADRLRFRGTHYESEYCDERRRLIDGIRARAVAE